MVMYLFFTAVHTCKHILTEGWYQPDGLSNVYKVAQLWLRKARPRHFPCVIAAFWRQMTLTLIIGCSRVERKQKKTSSLRRIRKNLLQ